MMPVAIPLHKMEAKIGNRKIVASIEARMTSTRLPGKVLKTVGDGKSLLQILIERLQRSLYIDEIVVATTTNDTDNPIEDLCRQIGVAVFRGSENDVLSRVVGAVASIKGDIIIEITGDCPLMDPLVVDYVVEAFFEHYPRYDYVCNTGLGNLHHHVVPIGMDVQVFSYKDLYKISNITTDPDDREHVSLFFYRDGKKKYSLLNVDIPGKWQRDYSVRLTVDTGEDFQAVSAIYDHLVKLKDDFSLEEILNFCDAHPEITGVNNHVKQKKPPGFK
ncbi:MAG: glycosyltransferase family protein [Desulfobulbaceae bacterium]|nr:glycosyltransferase family protein [Desulfobulbaceae bacterium]